MSRRPPSIKASERVGIEGASEEEDGNEGRSGKGRTGRRELVDLSGT
jgi:hypothetical protein